ncbi:hypothetical protein OE88DRAFT_1740471 [Heliocybe sulcata]|uniref:Uncharacterized protein n=1 Tax=Heliocybe sulcata TaxID=5364 RepID=A0A5C3MK06_9AGAM|nr:hypothetical protein OE88DRAFT_1740471 [Heliocybe sulcata]
MAEFMLSMTAIPGDSEGAEDAGIAGGSTSALTVSRTGTGRTAARKVGKQRVTAKKPVAKSKEGVAAESDRKAKTSTTKERKAIQKSGLTVRDSGDEGPTANTADVISIGSDSDDDTSDMPTAAELVAESLGAKKNKIPPVTPVKDKIMIPGNKHRIPGSDEDTQASAPAPASQSNVPSLTRKPVVKRQKVDVKTSRVVKVKSPVLESSPVQSNDIDQDEEEDSVVDDSNLADVVEGGGEDSEDVQEEGEEEEQEDPSVGSGRESDDDEENEEDDDRPRPVIIVKPATTSDDSDDRPKVVQSVDKSRKAKKNSVVIDKQLPPDPDLFKQFEDLALTKTYKDLPALRYWVNMHSYREFSGRAMGNVLFGSLKYHLQCHQVYAPCNIPLPNSSDDPICPHVKKDLEFIKASICFQQKGQTVVNLSRISPDVLHVTSQKESAIAVLKEDSPVICTSVVAVRECYLKNPVERSGFLFKYLSGVFYTFEWQRWLSVVGSVYDQTEHLVARMDGDAIQFGTSSGTSFNTVGPSTPGSRLSLFSPSKNARPPSSPAKSQVNRTLDLNDKVPIYDAHLGIVDRPLNWQKWIDRLDQVGLPEFTAEVPGGSTVMVGYTVTRWKPTKDVQGPDPVLSLNLQWVVVITSPVVEWIMSHQFVVYYCQ